MKTQVKPWKELSSNLQLRRNLQCALTPASQIGILATPNPYESPSDFRNRIEESRKNHVQFIRNLMESLGILKRDIPKKIHELKQREAALWKECRPDLENPNPQ
jgi:hypothetical protein